MTDPLHRFWLRLTGWNCLGDREVVPNSGLVAHLGYPAAVAEAAQMRVWDIDRRALRPNGQPRPGYRTFVYDRGGRLFVSLWRNARHAQRSP